MTTPRVAIDRSKAFFLRRESSNSRKKRGRGLISLSEKGTELRILKKFFQLEKEKLRVRVLLFRRNSSSEMRKRSRLLLLLRHRRLRMTNDEEPICRPPFLSPVASFVPPLLHVYSDAPTKESRTRRGRMRTSSHCRDDRRRRTCQRHPRTQIDVVDDRCTRGRRPRRGSLAVASQELS